MLDRSIAARTPGVTLLERRIGTMPWLRVTGPREACFRALGAHAAGAIQTILTELPQLGALRRRLEAPGGRARFDALVEATAGRFPLHVEEVSALAAGSGAGLETLLLLNLRGDLGDPRAGGCSDIGVAGERWVLGHNEDGDHLFSGEISGLTLDVEGESPVFALWYPGMLPANAFCLTGDLAWGIDHVPAEAEVVAPGRHFVARALQQESDLDGATSFLLSEPSAGAFAYNFVERATGAVRTIESGGGSLGRADAGGGNRMLWHTNHLRFPAANGSAPGASSCARGDVLGDIVERGSDGPLDRDSVLDILSTPLPHGVRAEGPSMTLCTVVVDGAAGDVSFVPSGGEAARVPIDDLLSCELLELAPRPAPPD